VAKLPRRKFLKTIGGAAVATALPRVSFGAQGRPRSIAFFWEPDFPDPWAGQLRLETLPVSVRDLAVVLSEQDLSTQLDATRFDLLVTLNGSMFPMRAWDPLLKYLRAGGNWLNIGGVPLKNPVIRNSSGWQTLPTQSTFHKQLGITHSFPVPADQIASYQTVAGLGLPRTSATESSRIIFTSCMCA
jgi:hypothetical protein